MVKVHQYSGVLPQGGRAAYRIYTNLFQAYLRAFACLSINTANTECIAYHTLQFVLRFSILVAIKLQFSKKTTLSLKKRAKFGKL